MTIWKREGLDALSHSPFSVSGIFRAVGFLFVSALLAACAGTGPDTTPQQERDAADEKQELREYNSRAIQHYMEGVSAQMQGNYAMAALEFQEALHFDSTSATIYSELAQTYLMLRKYDQAERTILAGLGQTGDKAEFLPMLGEVYTISQQFQKAIETNQQILNELSDETVKREALARLGEIYARQQKYPKVAEIYERLYQYDTDRIDYLKKAQRIYLQLGRFDDVKRLIQMLATDHPEGENYPLEMAKVYAESGATDSAITILQKLDKQNPNDEYKLLLGELYFRTGSADSAYTILRPFFDEDSTENRVLYYLGGSALNIGEQALADGDSARAQSFFDESEKYYRQLLRQNDSILGGYLGLGISLRQQEEYGASVQILEEGITQFPEEVELYEHQGISYYISQQYDSARSKLTTALQMDSTSMRSRHFLAFTYDQLGKKDSAEVIYKELLEAAPEEPLYLNNLAYMYAVEGKNLDKALEMVNRALELEPKNASYLDTKGWVYFQQGKYAKAKKYIEKALQISGANVEVLEHLGDVYSKLGQSARANELYDQALKLDPDNQEIRQKIR
ncbi:MAG: tetratricopeptide repeat protein [Candidatus Marinimicrobia bacterium]|nr:tetratricopeptide repeat protein [Candidatus Neomarinimicrobiota bacterium]MCF7829824.1 tetratricopeptide repeat protein [Candidatus Neomarinimicrobiota bacterium]MCF7881743.1 tetratricopeptide repeat protein [Candidatus Neomarinimicrobiota bacterium]